MILEHPLFGVGLGNWQFQYPAFARGDQVNVSAAPSRPHNDFLWITSELGAFGLFAYLAILLVAGRMAFQLVKRGEERTRTITLGVSLLILAHLGDGMFNFPRERIVPAFCFWFSLGCIARIHSETFVDTSRTSSIPPASHVVPLFIVLALALYVSSIRLRFDTHHLRVHLAERVGDWERVRQEAEFADAIGPLRFRTYTALGLARSRLGDLPGAESAYRKALTLHPNYPHTHNNLAIVFRRMGRAKEAIEALNSALYLYPGFPEAHNNMGQAFRDLGRYDEAIASYERALPLRQDVPQIYYNLGEAYRLKRQLHKAQASYLTALEKDPEFQPAIRGLARIGVTDKVLHGKSTDRSAPNEP
jgi:tetratricopeptide (TPR) repeat protein